VFPTLKRRDTTPRTSRGKTLSSDSMKIPPSDSELYLAITKAGHVERYQLQSYRFKPFFVTL
jgi:hypothetical protein